MGKGGKQEVQNPRSVERRKGEKRKGPKSAADERESTGMGEKLNRMDRMKEDGTGVGSRETGRVFI